MSENTILSELKNNPWPIFFGGFDLERELFISDRAVVVMGRTSKSQKSSAVDMMIDLYKQGFSIDDVAKKLCKRKSYVQYVLSNAGVVRKNKRGGRSIAPGIFVGRQIQVLNSSGEILHEFSSAKQASEITGINPSSISKSCLGKRKIKGEYGKYTWKYVD